MTIPQNPFGPPPPPPAAPPPNPFAPTAATLPPPQQATAPVQAAGPAFAAPPLPAIAMGTTAAATAAAAPGNPFAGNPLPTPDFGPKPTGAQPPAFPGPPVVQQESMAQWQERTARESRERAGLPPLPPQPGFATRVPEPTNVLAFPGNTIEGTATVVVSTSALVGEYIELRDKSKKINDEAADAVEPLKTRMTEIEHEMLGRLAADQVQSMKTSAGTVFKKTTTRFNVVDGEALMQWIEANGRLDMLARSVKQDAIKDFVDENGTLPPGIDTFSQVVAQFRK